MIAGIFLTVWVLGVGRTLQTSLLLRAQAGKNLKESEFRWKYALEGAGGGVWDWNVETDEVFISSRSRSMLGYDDDELRWTRQDWINLIHEDDRANVFAVLDQYLSSRSKEYVTEYRMLSKEGQWRWIMSRGIAVNRDADARALRLIGTHEDITHRKSAEEARQLAQLVYDHSTDGMLVMDSDDRILTVNLALIELTGYSQSELIGQDFSFLLNSVTAEHGNSLQVLKHSVTELGKWEGEVWSRRKDGQVHAEWLSINTIHERDGLPHRRVGLFSNLACKKQYELIIWQQANCDPLTGLLNRRIFLERLQRSIFESVEQQRRMTLFFIDLDQFKEVNDSMGHSAGDMLLKMVAERLKQMLSPGDTVARLGGDEFTVMSSTSHPLQLAQKLLLGLKEPFFIGDEKNFISGSVGITYFPDDGTSAEVIMRNADQAMYAAKALGRSRFQEFSPSMHDAVQQRVRTANDMRTAVCTNQFHLVYQPIVHLESGETTKAEVLLRWTHPQRGSISPLEFIPIAEKTDMIHAIGDWVFKKSMPELKQLRDHHDPDFQLSINISPAQFSDGQNRYLKWIENMERHGLSGSAVALEITEGLLLDDYAGKDIDERMLTLRSTGVQFSLDDFGTGYSSLSYLGKFSVDFIKIDQSFVKNLTQASSQAALCRAIIAMAHAIGIKVIAEGIETSGQRDLLLEMKCDYGQGYFFSKPVPFEQFKDSLGLNALKH